MINKFILLIFFLHSTFAFASGGFGGGVDQVSQERDKEKFHLGKAVYNEEIELSKDKTLKSETQVSRLEMLQNSLPNPEKKRVNLPNLAGRISDKQLEALEYFLVIRFNLKLEKK